jgi:iron complex outermembrane receptor protein
VRARPVDAAAVRAGAQGAAAPVVAALLAALPTPPAQAAPVVPTVLPEVTVSATRVARDPMDLPLSIDVVDSRTIREAGPQVNLSEALVRVPGIAVQNRQNHAQDLQLSSRGFGARASFGVRGVRLIADGIPATMPDGQGQTGSFNLPAAARIEVMRGPFSSLYGNAAGGVVQVFTADGPARPTLAGSVSGATYSSARIGFQYGGQHGPLNAVVDASRFETEGYRAHSAARRDQSNVRMKFDLGAAGTLTLVGNRLDQPGTKDPLGLTAAQAAQDPRQAVAAAYRFDTRKSTAQTQGGLAWDLPLGGGDTLHARWYAGDRQVTQYLATPLVAQAAPTSAGGVVDLDRGYAGVGLRWTRSTEVAGRAFTGSIGLDHDRMDERRRGFINDNGIAGVLKRDQDDSVANADIYAQAQWQVLPRLGLLAGLRHSRVRFASRDAFIRPGNPDDSGGRTFVRTTPAAGLTWNVTPLVNAYANAGRGFETPTFAELAYQPGGASGLNLALRPSNSLHREVGVKALAGDHGQLNLALFQVDVKDEIVVNSASGGRTDFRNASATRRQGIELAWRQRVAPGVETAVAWTALDARFREPFTSGGTGGTVAAGNRLPGVSPRLAHAELAWRHPDSGLHAGLEVRYSGKVFVNDQNAEAAAAYTIGSLRGGLQQRGRGWRLTEYVRIDNLTGRRHVGSVIVADANGRFYEPAPGRTITVGVTLEIVR